MGSINEEESKYKNVVKTPTSTHPQPNQIESDFFVIEFKVLVI
jgi:hypothetical protein